MSYALHFLFLPDQVGRGRQLRQQVVQGLDLSYRLQQQEKRGERDVVRGAALKLVDGRGREARLLRDLLLRHVAAQAVVLEAGAKELHQLGDRVLVIVRHEAYFNLYCAISYARFWAISYIPLIFISHAKIRVFSRLSKHSWGKSFSRPLFFSFSAEGTCRLSCRRSADVKERMPFRGRAIYKKRRLSVKYTQ